jgi:hypothetical protein
VIRQPGDGRGELRMSRLRLRLEAEGDRSLVALAAENELYLQNAVLTLLMRDVGVIWLVMSLLGTGRH